MARIRYLTTVACGVALNLVVAAASAEVVVVVSAQNPVTAIEAAQLSDIYLGRAKRWPHGNRVVPLDQAESTPAYETFYATRLGRSTAQIKAHWSKRIFTGRGHPPRSVPDGEAMADAVAGDPRAIGYLDSALVDDRLRVLAIE